MSNVGQVSNQLDRKKKHAWTSLLFVFLLPLSTGQHACFLNRQIGLKQIWKDGSFGPEDSPLSILYQNTPHASLANIASVSALIALMLASSIPAFVFLIFACLTLFMMHTSLLMSVTFFFQKDEAFRPKKF